MPDVKSCTKCGEVKPLDDYYRQRKMPDGRQPRCKTCAAEYQRRHYAENRDKELERARRWREENRDKVREIKRRYYEENREFCIRGTARRGKETQDNTALTATRKGKPWTPAEDDILTADDGRNLFEKALLLGRTYKSCVGRRATLNRAAA